MNIDDSRESPSAEIIELLRDRGADVCYHDPHIPTYPSMRKYRIDLKSVALTPDVLRSMDCVLILTDHDAVDYGALAEHATLVVDTRNAMARVPAGTGKARVVELTRASGCPATSPSPPGASSAPAASASTAAACSASSRAACGRAGCRRMPTTASASP